MKRKSSVTYLKTQKRARRGTEYNPIYVGRVPKGGLNARTAGYLGIETKFIDYEYNAAVSKALAGAEADPAVGALNAIAQGDSENNRDGRKCTLVGLYIKGYIERDPVDQAGTISELTSAATCRLVVVQDTQSNGAQLNAEDVFEDPTDTALEPLVFRNLQYTKRFRILHDECIDLDITAIAANSAAGTPFIGGADRKHFSVSKQITLNVLHSGTTADISNITDNSLHVLCFSGANDADCTLRYISRIRFRG